MSEQKPVFDFAPLGMLDTYGDERFEPLIDELLAEGIRGEEVFARIRDEQVRELRRDESFRRQLRNIYDRAGVNLVSSTLSSYGRDGPIDHRRGIIHDLSRWEARFDAIEWLHKVTSPERAREVVADGDIGVVLNTQNLGKDIQGEVAEIETLYNFGLRIAQLTYNSQNLIGTGCTERVDCGLSGHGVDVVNDLNERDVIVDLSHVGRATTLETIEESADPVMFSHTFCQTLTDHPRGKTDEELCALVDNDGFVGIQSTPPFIAPGEEERSFEVFFDHIDHAISLLGVNNVGIGQDWGPMASTEVPERLHDDLLAYFRARGFREEHNPQIAVGVGPMDRFDDWGRIPVELAERGYSSREIDKIVGENFLAFWERVVG